MKTLIVDDEAPARLELRRLLSVHPGVDLVGEAASVGAALEQTALHRPELVFLDVHLRGESGFDYVARLPEGGATPRVIFLTAHDRYALRAFECNALDYLLKPVHPDRLASSLKRLASPALPSAPVTEDDVVFVKAGSAARFIPWRDIHAITADGNYTHLHLCGGDRLIVLRPLKQWLPLAPADRFLRVHRSTIVQRRAVAELRTTGEKKRVLILTCGREMPVGREYFAGLNLHDS
ncbi:MAG TPA: LytTR family DNA-binding domain-containing protein [Chthoniobacteraceae bacterium]|nr:LytTR family DNA-binding domain-containing protein [Chthoniobacteraceae bacterium]